MYRCLAPSRRSIPFDVDSRAAISIGEIRTAVTSIFRPKWLRFLVLLRRGCWLSTVASGGAAAGETVSSSRGCPARLHHPAADGRPPGSRTVGQYSSAHAAADADKNSDDRDLHRSPSSRNYYSHNTFNCLLFPAGLLIKFSTTPRSIPVRNRAKFLQQNRNAREAALHICQIRNFTGAKIVVPNNSRGEEAAVEDGAGDGHGVVRSVRHMTGYANS